MRRKYGDCNLIDGDCTACSRVIDRRDCHGREITNLEWQRRTVGMSIKELAEKSGVSQQQIINAERGVSVTGNMTARNLLAIADAMGVDMRTLL